VGTPSAVARKARIANYRSVMSANFGFAYWDENGVSRVGLNAAGIGYHDANGNLVWSTRCAPNC
jgi:hypothetical protein